MPERPRLCTYLHSPSFTPAPRLLLMHASALSTAAAALVASGAQAMAKSEAATGLALHEKFVQARERSMWSMASGPSPQHPHRAADRAPPLRHRIPRSENAG
eukprot:6210611-Pleurochrysis_carterae.AAC.3